MELKPADDFDLVKAKYIEVIENTPQIEKYARWVYGKHPTDEMLKTYIGNGEMYLLMDGDDVVGMAAIVMHQDEEYECISWAQHLANDQVATIHILAVCPNYRGRMLGNTIIEEAMDLARSKGKKALRLDVLKSNLPAQRMYEETGFTYRGEENLYAENTGWTVFLFYEKILD